MAKIADFNWEDPLDLESTFGRRAHDPRFGAGFCEDKLAPRVKSAFRDERFDARIMSELGEMGFLGVMTSEAYGGSGWAMWPMASWRGKWSAWTRAIVRL